MTRELDIKDRKILDCLSLAARQPDSAIAKKVGLSREVVSYRVKRLEKLGIIKDYITLVDSERLGYLVFHVYLRLKNFDTKKEEEIISLIKSDKYVKWLISISGQYDLFFVMVARTKEDLDSQLTFLYSSFEDHISESLILSIVKTFKEGEFFFNKRSERTGSKIKQTVPISSPELKKIDYEILDIISKDARSNVVDISRSLKKAKIDITPEGVAYRLKRLEESGVIRGYRSVIDYDKIGLLWYMLLLNLRRVPSDLEMKIKELAKQNPKIIYSDKTLGEWNIRIELLVKDHEEFHQELIKIRNLIGDFLNRYELIVVFNDYNMVSFTKGMYDDLSKDI